MDVLAGYCSRLAHSFIYSTPSHIYSMTYFSMNDSLLKQKQQIIDDMVSYMRYGAADDETDEEYDPDFDAGYTQEHVEECDLVLTDFLKRVNAHSSADPAVLMNDVKTVVLALNQLNEKCDCSIIETLQRDDICTLIDDALEQVGLNFESDVTEEWRNW
jgi:hypothetical protein